MLEAEVARLKELPPDADRLSEYRDQLKRCQDDLATSRRRTADLERELKAARRQWWDFYQPLSPAPRCRSSHLKRYYCTRPAGHEGSHEDGAGASWVDPPEPLGWRDCPRDASGLLSDGVRAPKTVGGLRRWLRTELVYLGVLK